MGPSRSLILINGKRKNLSALLYVQFSPGRGETGVDLSAIPQDHFFWHLLAFTTGTGGSMLIIGSASGVAAMGMEKITFTYYIRKFSWLAGLGFIAGILVLLITQ
jgi:Na+/H+ antiporter NhaD/arsenite permease-like protein